MPDQRMTLPEFLLARVGEDEAKVEYMTSEANRAATAPIFAGHPAGWLTGIDIFVSPTRWRAECDAKRRLIARAAQAWDNSYCTECCEAGDLADDLLRLIALAYAAHPDYREEWRL